MGQGGPSIFRSGVSLLGARLGGCIVQIVRFVRFVGIWLTI